MCCWNGSRPKLRDDGSAKHTSEVLARVFWALLVAGLHISKDVDGDDAMEASDGEPPAKRVRAHAPQAAAAAVGAGPSSASRPRQRGKRPSSGGRGNARGDRRGHQQGRGGGGVNPQSLTA
ncbi:hypothetical protein Vretifemale_14830, partial [Volvox reticuliferus]